jgi:hypothetical protein
MFALCILISSKSLIYQQMHFISVLENIESYIKIYIKIAATCFGLDRHQGSLYMSIAKVTFIKLVKVRRYGLGGYVAAWWCVCCEVFHSAQHTVHSTQHTTHSTQYTAHSTQHTTQHTTHNTAHSTQHTAHNTQHTTHSTQYTAHNTQHTVHSTQHTAHTTA